MRRAAAERLANLYAIQATREDAALPESVDLALIVNVQGLVKEPNNYFDRLRAKLKPAGRVAIIAFRPDAAEGTPIAMRVPEDRVKSDMARQGYVLVAEHDFCLTSTFWCFALWTNEAHLTAPSISCRHYGNHRGCGSVTNAILTMPAFCAIAITSVTAS